MNHVRTHETMMAVEDALVEGENIDVKETENSGVEVGAMDLR